MDALNRQKEDFAKIQEKMNTNIQKNKEELLGIQTENESVQEELARLKKDLEDHNKSFEGHSKVFSTKVIRLVYIFRSLKWNESRQRRCPY